MNKNFLFLFLILVLIVPTFLLGRFSIVADMGQMSLPILIALSFWQLISSVLCCLVIRQYLIIKAREKEVADRLKGEVKFREFQKEEREWKKKEHEIKQAIFFQHFESLLEIYKRGNTVTLDSFKVLYDWFEQKNL